MNLMKFSNILLLSPHPDDIEFSMAGTILKYTETQFTSIVFSTGSVYDPVTNEARWEECKKYWNNVKNIKQIFPTPLMKTYTEEEWLVLLEQIVPLKGILGKQPCFDAIFIPPLLDTHYEHRIVHHIGMAMTRTFPASVVEYRSASATDDWIPNMFVKLHSGLIEEKVNRLKYFESQQKIYLKPEYMNIFHSHINSLKRGVQKVEQFRLVTHYE